MGAGNTTEMRMADEVMEKSPKQVRGRPFPKGTVGKPRQPPVWLTQQGDDGCPALGLTAFGLST